VDAEDLEDMIAELKRLTPKPGLGFGADGARAVEADVMVRERPDGGWAVELNTDTLPRVLMNNRYAAQISASARSEDEKVFISQCTQNASWLVKSLDQRARTILKVASEIVRQQDAFFAKGVAWLRPLNLKTVADAVGMHESTVSRVTSNKYMATPRGLFELKYFFTSAIASADGGEAYSAEAVRFRIKAMIESETIEDVMSDDKIVERLLADGVDIARRTVAKYREAMNIPSSVKRRRKLKGMG
jgi:RNA polymerase sigma-54 factor